MKGSRWQNVALAGALAGAAVLFCFAPVFFAPYLYKDYRPDLPAPWVLALAAAAAALAMAVALARPKSRPALVRLLAVTTFVYLVFRPLSSPWSYWLSTLPLTPTQQYWAFRGPGGAVLGLLPSTVAVLLGGRYLFGMSVREQWNGRLRPALRDLGYGGLTALGMCAVFLAAIAASGQGRITWEPNWAGHGANLFSNLYEEVLARGLLLQVSRRVGGNWFGMLWTALIFGTMHGFRWFALGVALTTWVMAWAVLRAGSLWAGYVLHQVLDVIMDSLLH